MLVIERGIFYIMKEQKKYNNRFNISPQEKRRLQQEVIKLELPTKYNKLYLYAFNNDIDNYIKTQDDILKISDNLEQEISELVDYKVTHHMIRWASSNLNKANYKRYKRLRDKTQNIIENNKGYFLTLTFTDEVLNNTTPQTRRRYVTRTLKEISNNYIANKDFGSKTEREHYHAIIESDTRPTLKTWKTKYGFVKIQKIANTENDAKRVARYTSKLTYHAIKSTTTSERIIYSKNI